jgi:signal transduction histidine kinase
MKSEEKSMYRDARILIVDDVYRNIQLAGIILQQDSFRFSFATDGESALRLAQEGGLDLILLDIMMPGMDGYTVCRRLKENPATADIPVIFLTAMNDTDSIVKGFDLGAVDYLTKPFQAAELLARVHTHLKLRITERDLRMANAAKDRFFSIIAHDLRSPFTALLGVSEFLKEGLDELDPETAKDLIGGIHSASRNVFNLLENLLEWARIQTGTASLDPDEVHLAAAVRENLQLFLVKIENKDIQVVNTVSDNMSVYADPNAVNTVIRNLLSNAIKYSPRGGKIELNSGIEGKRVSLAVRDYGMGMSREQQNSLFLIDERSRIRGTEQEEGTGLGLILSREFLDRSGGTISVESSPGEGSVFTITLPSPAH